jgi:outer membrane protein OmpA-like peptidoglycan-associated protein
MKKSKLILTILILIPLISTFLYSQEVEKSIETQDSLELKPYYGINFGYNYNFHSTDFRSLPGVPSCCPQYKSGSGSGYYIGAIFDYPINYIMQVTAKLNYTQINGKFTVYEQTPVLIDGKEETGEFEHYVDSKFSLIGLEPLFTYKPLTDLGIHAGFRFGFLTTANYYQIEKISKPADRGTFIDGRTYRNQSSGSILDSANSLLTALKIGVSYKLPFNKQKSLFIVPELFYTYNFTDLIKDRKWQVHQFSLGLSIKYRIPPPPPPPPAPPIAPPDPEIQPVIKSPLFVADVDAIEIDTNKKENKDFTLKIEDFVSYNMRPLLNYIFFDENSSEIPNRYVLFTKEITSKFDLAQLSNLNALETYYFVLNIVGKRLKDNESSTINLVGTNQDYGAEKGNIQLSQERAKAVANYFVNVWGISPDRIKISARNLPDQHSRIDDPQGMQENRRVEITSNDPSITEPVFTIDTMRVINTAEIKFIPKILTEVGVHSWDVAVKQKDKIVLNHKGEGDPPKSISWEINQKTVPKSDEDLAYFMTAMDSVGQITSSKIKRIPISKKSIEMKRRTGQSDKEYEYYSLILFDYGKSDLGREHKKVVDFVKNRINDRSKIFIYGFTDAMGDEEVNKKISDKRAISVLKRLNINSNVVYEGKGESELLYDNSLPEGRFYCRTVTINIETPVKNE